MKIEIPVYTFIPLIFLFSYVLSMDYLAVIEKPCVRQCDSHFSGANCWKNTYDYYINHLLQSIVQYKNAIQINNLDSVLTLNSTYSSYIAHEDGIVKLLNEFFTVYNVNFREEIIMDLGKKLIKAEYVNEQFPKRESKCPNKCSYESLVVWMSLFGLFIGLTIATVIFVVAFVLISKWQIHKFDKKSNSH